MGEEYEKITKKLWKNYKKKNYEKENRDTFVFLDGFHDQRIMVVINV